MTATLLRDGAGGQTSPRRLPGLVSVLIADEQDLVRLGLRALLAAADDCTVAGEVADGLAAVREARRIRPDVVLIGNRLPGIDGIEATRRITADPDLAATNVVVLAASGFPDDVTAAICAGAHGFLHKSTSPAALLTGIRTIARGGASLDPSATRTLIERFLDGAPRVRVPHPRIGDLTRREREVAVLAAQGRNNGEIAAQLFLSPATVRTHIGRGMTKLGARDRAQFVAFVYQSGLV